MSSPRPLTAPTGADLISSNPGRGSLRGGDLKGRSRKGMDLAGPEPPFSLLRTTLWLHTLKLPLYGLEVIRSAPVGAVRGRGLLT